MKTPPRTDSPVFTFVLSAGCLLILGGFHPLYADVVSEFSLASNPNGVWSYGTLSSFTGGSLSLFTVAQSNINFPGSLEWDNGGSIPNNSSVEMNSTSTTQSYATIVLPPNMLRLDGENYIDDVRWTAPASGVYNLTGLFQRIDTDAYPVNVGVVENATTVLFDVNGLNPYGAQAPFNLTNVSLLSGTTLDFEEQGDQFYDDSTGLELTVSSAVPEPSVFLLTLVGVLFFLASPKFQRIPRRT